MIRIEDYRLFFQSPDTHEEAEMAVEFRRTLRIPDDGKTHMLPPSHRAFPLEGDPHGLRRVDWHDHTAALAPFAGNPVATVVHMLQAGAAGSGAIPSPSRSAREPLAAAKSAEEIAAERGDRPLTPVGVVLPDLVISVDAAPSRA